VFIPPCLLAGKVLFLLLGSCVWGRWRICNLGDQICCRRLSNTVYQHSEQRNSQEHVEPDAKAKEESLPAAKPIPFLLLVEMYACKIRLEKFAHQTSRCKVGLQKYHKVAFGEEDACAENDSCGTQANSFVERIEASSGEDKFSSVRNVRQAKDDQRDESFAGKSPDEQGNALASAC